MNKVESIEQLVRRANNDMKVRDENLKILEKQFMDFRERIQVDMLALVESKTKIIDSEFKPTLQRVSYDTEECLTFTRGTKDLLQKLLNGNKV